MVIHKGYRWCSGIATVSVLSVVSNLYWEAGEHMAQTRADAAVMRQTAARFDDVSRGLEAMLSGLLTELAALQSAWQGAGGRSFQQVQTQWAADQRAIQQALVETAAALRASGTGYDAIDTQAAGRVAATNRGISLPL
jgi:WXG100 family type VII secretion target